MSETNRVDGRPELRVLPDDDAVAAAAARSIADGLNAAIEARGVAHWVTTGGSAAPGIYHHLARTPLRDLVDWSRVHVWWGDDRFVPPDHPLSNVLPFTQVLLTSGGDEEGGSPEGADVGGHGDGVRIPASQIHQVAITEAIAHAGGAAWAATGYANAIREHGPATDASPATLPAFDVFVVGVGPDGHILSVFPGSAVWDSPALSVAVPAPTHIEPHVDRVTMHPRAGRGGAARRRRVGGGLEGRPCSGARGRATIRVSSRSGPRASARRPGSSTRPRPPTSRGPDPTLAGALPRRPVAVRRRPGRHVDRGVLRGRGAAARARARHDRGPPHVAGRRPGARDALAAARDRPARPRCLGRRSGGRLFDRAGARGPGRGGRGRRGRRRRRAGRRRRALAGRADRARREPAHRGDPADRGLRVGTAPGRRGRHRPGAGRAPPRGPRGAATSTACSRGS